MLSSAFLRALGERVLVFDGAMGTRVQSLGLGRNDYALPGADAAKLEGCHEVLNLTRPDVVGAIHAEYLEAGADIVETNTFGCTSIVLGEYGLEERVEEVARAAGRIARETADRFSTPDRPRFVAGAIGPGTKLISLGQTEWRAMVDTYSLAFRALLEEGADLLMLETCQDLLMVKAGLVAMEEAIASSGRDVPALVQVTMEQTGTMLLGSELAAALNFIECFPRVVAFGLNCATGPVEMAGHVRFLGENSTRPISVQPNAGLPVMEKGRSVYKLTPQELADHGERFVTECGAALVGGCCGTTPEHIRALAERVGGRTHPGVGHWQRVRSAFPGFDFRLGSPERDEAVRLKGCSSLYQFQPYEQDNSFLIVGEKTNANGSKQFRTLLGMENWEALTEMARELEAEGSHVLDVCTAYVGRDEREDMRRLLFRLNTQVTVPIMVDSTETPVMEAALQTLAGKPILNSINLEDGGERAERVLDLCRRYGAAVVALTIDERGMALTAERKVEIAERLLARTRAAGLPDWDVFVDCLTFTLGSGDEEYRKAGIETLQAIRELRLRHPRVNAILGVSNVSFGLKPAARVLLNSVFLHYALEAGLTAAIVHFSKIKPENQIDPELWKIASDLVFDRREFAEA
ncbi:MAG: homocysteine S-methyltransferase family protein [Fimbriimonadales bacterium]|nr:homocysteine S-methyltransferase family protein [Fimbriimonadales bacterium]